MDIEAKAKAYSAAWSSGDAAQVAGHYAADGKIAINQGDELVGTQAITDMAAGFYAEFPDLQVHCDMIRAAGDHAIFVWTLEGHHSETKNYVKVGGWEEWTLDGAGLVASSLGWFDAEDYQRQIDGV